MENITERIRRLEKAVFGETSEPTKEAKLEGKLHAIFHNFRRDEVVRKQCRQFSDQRLSEAIAEVMVAIKEEEC